MRSGRGGVGGRTGFEGDEHALQLLQEEGIAPPQHGAHALLLHRGTTEDLRVRRCLRKVSHQSPIQNARGVGAVSVAIARQLGGPKLVFSASTKVLAGDRKGRSPIVVIHNVPFLVRIAWFTVFRVFALWVGQDVIHVAPTPARALYAAEAPFLASPSRVFGGAVAIRAGVKPKVLCEQ